jgi:ribosome-associated translation inhibitor RaiA
MVETRLGKRVGPEDPAQGITFEVHAPDVEVPPDVAGYAREKLVTKLARFGHQITGVVMHVRDVNGTRGGDGTVCHLEARLSHHEPVNVAERNHDLRAVIDLAVERLAEAVTRHLRKEEGKRRAQERKIVRPSKQGL